MANPVRTSNPEAYPISGNDLSSLLQRVTQQQGGNAQPASPLTPGLTPETLGKLAGSADVPARNEAMNHLGVIRPLLLGHAARSQLLQRFYGDQFSKGLPIDQKLTILQGEALQMQDRFPEIPHDIFTDFLSVVKPHLDSWYKVASPEEQQHYDQYMQNLSSKYPKPERLQESSEGQM